MKIICSSSALFNPASRDFASRGSIFSSIGNLDRKKSLPWKKSSSVSFHESFALRLVLGFDLSFVIFQVLQ